MSSERILSDPTKIGSLRMPTRNPATVELVPEEMHRIVVLSRWTEKDTKIGENVYNYSTKHSR